MFTSSFLSSYSSFGIGGARAGGSPFCLPAALAAMEQIAAYPEAKILTSCSSGASSLARARFPTAQVFKASDMQGLNSSQALAARAVKLVRSLSLLPAPLWICFPAIECPDSITSGYSKTWKSCGSGSWSECRLAAALDIPVLIFLPCGLRPPKAWGHWTKVAASAGGLWWILPSSGKLF